MNYLDWHVGMKVVCIAPNDGTDDSHHPGWRIADDGVRLERNNVYTIREVYIDPIDQQITVLLCEITRNATADEREAGIPEPGFFARRFRPVQLRTTSIAVFQALLNPSPADREYIELEDLEHSEPQR